MGTVLVDDAETWVVPLGRGVKDLDAPSSLAVAGGVFRWWEQPVTVGGWHMHVGKMPPTFTIPPDMLSHIGIPWSTGVQRLDFAERAESTYRRASCSTTVERTGVLFACCGCCRAHGFARWCWENRRLLTAKFERLIGASIYGSDGLATFQVVGIEFGRTPILHYRLKIDADGRPVVGGAIYKVTIEPSLQTLKHSGIDAWVDRYLNVACLPYAEGVQDAVLQTLQLAMPSSIGFPSPLLGLIGHYTGDSVLACVCTISPRFFAHLDSWFAKSDHPLKPTHSEEDLKQALLAVFWRGLW